MKLKKTDKMYLTTVSKHKAHTFVRTAASAAFDPTNERGPNAAAAAWFSPRARVLYEPKCKQSLTSMTKATTSCGRKYCVVLTYAQLHQTSLQL